MASKIASTVRRLAVVPLGQAPTPEAEPAEDFRPAPLAPPEPAQPELMDVVLAAFGALGYALSARALLLLSLVGAFVLGLCAMLNPSPMRLATMVAYGVLTVVPCAWLEFRRREG